MAKKKKLSKKLKKIKLNAKFFRYVLIGLGIVGLLYYFKGSFVVTWVNGKPITRMAYVKELEKIGKAQAVDSLVTKMLIEMEAKKQGVVVEQGEIDEAFKTIEEQAKTQGSSLDELLELQGFTKEEVAKEIRLQKTLEKLVGEDQVAEEEINEYWETNQSYYGEETFEDVKEEIKDQLKQQKQIGKMQELITRLKTEAQIVNWD